MFTFGGLQAVNTVSLLDKEKVRIAKFSFITEALGLELEFALYKNLI